MGWKARAVVILAIGLLVSVTLFMSFAVYARYQANDYIVQVAASFNAASLVNGEETYTDPERAVISSYEGRQYVILPENYKPLVSLLRKDNAMPPFRRVAREAPLTIALCDSATLRIEPDTADGALIAFTSDAGRRFTMHVHGGNIWKQIVEYATVGHGDWKNLPLQ